MLHQEHFPPISKPGGVWMSLVDDTGKKWSFEFCFWYSKESRIYYFKKFYPFVQARNLRGGDTGARESLLPEALFLGLNVSNQLMLETHHHLKLLSLWMKYSLYISFE